MQAVLERERSERGTYERVEREEPEHKITATKNGGGDRACDYDPEAREDATTINVGGADALLAQLIAVHKQLRYDIATELTRSKRC